MKLGDKLTKANYTEGAIFCNKNGYVINSQTMIIEEKPQELEKSYQQKRQEAYPPLAEQLDMIYWDKVNGTNVWTETISAIKAKYPKE